MHFFLFYIFQGTNKYIVLLQQENLIFVEILEQSFSKIYHQMGKLLYIFLKFIWKYNKYIVYYFSEFIGAKYSNEGSNKWPISLYLPEKKNIFGRFLKTYEKYVSL